MASECFERPIERPSGISGYRPASWCAVCGRKGSQQTVRQCYKEGCSNFCHVKCLGNAADFRCGNTGKLRAMLGIDDRVFPYLRHLHGVPTPTHTETADDEPEDDLNNLPKEELLQLVRNLRQDLASVKSQLTNYKSVTEDLVDKRQVLVEALSVVDTLIATHDFEGTQHKSVACSARPHKIDAEMGPAVLDENNPLPPSDLLCSNSSSSSSAILPSQPSSSSSSPPNSYPLFSPYPLQPSLPPTLPSAQHNSPSISTPVSSLPPSHPNLPPTLPPQHSTSFTPPVSSTASIQLNPPLTIPQHYTASTSSAPPQPKPTWERAPQLQRAAAASKPSEERDAERQRRPKRGSQRLLGGNKPPSRERPASGEEAFGQGQQPRQETYPRRQQTKCPLCKRQGHSRDQCPRELCDYCQGRYHSSLTCRARLADQRQQELVQAVRQSGQDTLLALRSFAWQLHQPSQLQAARSTVAVPPGVPAHQSSWPVPVPAYPAYYGAGPY